MSKQQQKLSSDISSLPLKISALRFSKKGRFEKGKREKRDRFIFQLKVELNQNDN